MGMLSIFFSAFVIGLSGAMMPGPLLTYTINSSLKEGVKAGPLLILGHAILELLLIILLFLGLNRLFQMSIFSGSVGIIGGGILFYMGYGMVKSAWKQTLSIETAPASTYGLIVPGAVISLSNPYWILWWATIGMNYIISSSSLGIAGISAFYLGHISADFLWYGAIAWVFATGRKFMNNKVYYGLVAFFGAVLIFFAVLFIRDGIAKLV